MEFKSREVDQRSPPPDRPFCNSCGEKAMETMPGPSPDPQPARVCPRGHQFDWPHDHDKQTVIAGWISGLLATQRPEPDALMAFVFADTYCRRRLRKLQLRDDQPIRIARMVEEVWSKRQTGR